MIWYNVCTTNAIILILTLIFISFYVYGDIPQTPSNGVCISKLIRFALVSTHVDDFKNATSYS